MIFKKKFLGIVLLFIGMKSLAQITTALQGTWKGTSICQVKNSPCHDETVVYHISKKDSLGNFQFIANKIVDNKEEAMGILIFKYDASTHTLTSTDAGRDATWTFKVKGNTIDGNLVYKKVLYRIVNVIKQ